MKDDSLFRTRKVRSFCTGETGGNNRGRRQAMLADPTLHVVLDPGHGGNDPGATVEDRRGKILFEKDITLAVVKQVVSMLPPEVCPHVTRRTDVTVSLTDRALRCADYDLLVSVHCNALADADRAAKVRGTEVIVYSLKDELLVRLAKHFLAHLTVGTDIPANEPNPIRSNPHLAVLAKAEKRRDRFGRSPSILRPAAYSDSHGEKGKGVPALILELGYMTNAADLKLLRSKTYQKQAAKAIASAITALAPCAEAGGFAMPEQEQADADLGQELEGGIRDEQ